MGGLPCGTFPKLYGSNVHIFVNYIYTLNTLVSRLLKMEPGSFPQCGEEHTKCTLISANITDCQQSKTLDLQNYQGQLAFHSKEFDQEQS